MNWDSVDYYQQSVQDFIVIDLDNIFESPRLFLINNIDTESGNKKQYKYDLAKGINIMDIFNKVEVVQLNNSTVKYNLIYTSKKVNHISEEFVELLSFLYDKYGVDKSGRGPMTHSDKKEITDPNGLWLGREWRTEEGDLRIYGSDKIIKIALWRGHK